MAIELIQKQTSREKIDSVVKLKSWLAVFIGVLILSLVCYGGLLGYKKYLEGNLDELDNQIVEMLGERDSDIENMVKALDKQIRGMKIVLNNRLYWSKAFAAIEELTLPQLYFSSFSGSVDNTGFGKISFGSNTVNFGEAAKELQLFKDGLFFKNIQTDTLEVDEGRSIEFSLNAEFDASNLKNQPY